MSQDEPTIKLRIDVDYPFPSSRMKSFLYIALGIKSKKNSNYLKNARITAKMINESPKKVKAYWFFTPFTIPDKKLLELLKPERHEIGLHIANNAVKEWKTLEKETGRMVQLYTFHGTSSSIAQLLWRRKLGQKQATVPSDFPLKSFHENVTTSLDRRVYETWLPYSIKDEIQKWVKQGTVISIHPEWLFVKNKKSGRGPYYNELKDLLDVDRELNTISIRKKLFVRIAQDNQEYEKNPPTAQEYVKKLEEHGADIYTFLERSWCCPIVKPDSNWILTDDNVGLLEVTTLDSWLATIGKKTRNMIRKAEKSGVKVNVVELTPKLIEGIWKIYNETPFRQGRAFHHYGQSFQSVADNMAMAKDSTFIGAYLEGELLGFIQIIYGDQVAIISQILSLQKHWDKSLNNALIAKAVEVCAANGNRWLMYGRIGNHPSLDKFKESNGFVKYPIARYYVPLTGKGRFAIRLGLHKPFKDALPEPLKDPLIPVFNWISRTKARLKPRRKK